MEKVYEEEVNLMDYITVILKHRKMIIIICTLTVLATTIISLLLPEIYMATASILPPKTESTLSGMVSGMGGISSFAGGALGIKSGADLYVGMLKSRTISDALIDRFSLMEVYNAEYREEARNRLDGNTTIKKAKEGIITVSVEDKDPRRAAEIANAYLDELDRLNKKLNITEAGKKRIFLEKRLKDTERDLARAEENLKRFQKGHKVVAMDAQAMALIEAAGRIQGEIAAAETELGILKEFSTEESLKVINLKSRIRELKKQLAEIEKGKLPTSANPSKNPDSLYTPFTKVPDLGLQLARLTREVKIQETVYELLTKEYELTKIQEAKDTPTIQILDRAKPPEKRFKPKRRQMVMLSGFISLFFSIFLAFASEYFKRMREEANHT
ncbi:MAG: GNVR domain-containing protein [bacterium]|nr:GNVR domain-containing protein [bacterium]